MYSIMKDYSFDLISLKYLWFKNCANIILILIMLIINPTKTCTFWGQEEIMLKTQEEA